MTVYMEDLKRKYNISDLATEFRVGIPVLGSDTEKLLMVAKEQRSRMAKMEQERLTLLAEIDEAALTVERLEREIRELHGW